MITALVLVASLSTPTTLTSPTSLRSTDRPVHRPAATAAVDGAHKGAVRLAQNTPAADPNAPDHTQTFIEQYLSYQLSPAATPAIKDGQIMSIVLGYLCSPACGSLWGPIVMVKGAEFTADVAITWLLSSILWTVITSAASLTVVGGLIGLAVPYLQTTATLNALDVQMKKKGLKGSTPGKPVEPAKPADPAPSADAPPPSYAY
jgi:hypothetical protein